MARQKGAQTPNPETATPPGSAGDSEVLRQNIVCPDCDIAFEFKEIPYLYRMVKGVCPTCGVDWKFDDPMLRKNCAYLLSKPETCSIKECAEPAYVLLLAARGYDLVGCLYLCFGHYIFDTKRRRANPEKPRLKRSPRVVYQLMLHPKDERVAKEANFEGRR